MSNVVKFERRPDPKEPKQKKALSPSARKILAWIGVGLSLVLAWVYFSLTGPQAAVL